MQEFENVLMYNWSLPEPRGKLLQKISYTFNKIPQIQKNLQKFQKVRKNLKKYESRADKPDGIIGVIWGNEGRNIWEYEWYGFI